MRKGSHHSEETRAKLRKAWETRTPPTREQLEPMFASNRGRPKSEEHKRKLSEQKIGPGNPRWDGGRWVRCDGYVFVKKPEHPGADTKGYVQEHRLVMEESIGRHLEPGEVVHHINEDPSDNRLENLLLFGTTAEHTSYHRQKLIAGSTQGGATG